MTFISNQFGQINAAAAQQQAGNGAAANAGANGQGAPPGYSS